MSTDSQSPVRLSTDHLSRHDPLSKLAFNSTSEFAVGNHAAMSFKIFNSGIGQHHSAHPLPPAETTRKGKQSQYEQLLNKRYYDFKGRKIIEEEPIPSGQRSPKKESSGPTTSVVVSSAEISRFRQQRLLMQQKQQKQKLCQFDSKGQVIKLLPKSLLSQAQSRLHAVPQGVNFSFSGESIKKLWTTKKKNEDLKLLEKEPLEGGEVPPIELSTRSMKKEKRKKLPRIIRESNVESKRSTFMNTEQSFLNPIHNKVASNPKKDEQFVTLNLSYYNQQSASRLPAAPMMDPTSSLLQKHQSYDSTSPGLTKRMQDTKLSLNRYSSKSSLLKESQHNNLGQSILSSFSNYNSRSPTKLMKETDKVSSFYNSRERERRNSNKKDIVVQIANMIEKPSTSEDDDPLKHATTPLYPLEEEYYSMQPVQLSEVYKQAKASRSGSFGTQTHDLEKNKQQVTLQSESNPGYLFPEVAISSRDQGQKFDLLGLKNEEKGIAKTQRPSIHYNAANPYTNLPLGDSSSKEEEFSTLKRFLSNLMSANDARQADIPRNDPSIQQSILHYFSKEREQSKISLGSKLKKKQLSDFGQKREAYRSKFDNIMDKTSTLKQDKTSGVFSSPRGSKILKSGRESETTLEMTTNQNSRQFLPGHKALKKSQMRENAIKIKAKKKGGEIIQIGRNTHVNIASIRSNTPRTEAMETNKPSAFNKQEQTSERESLKLSEEEEFNFIKKQKTAEAEVKPKALITKQVSTGLQVSESRIDEILTNSIPQSSAETPYEIMPATEHKVGIHGKTIRIPREEPTSDNNEEKKEEVLPTQGDLEESSQNERKSPDEIPILRQSLPTSLLYANTQSQGTVSHNELYQRRQDKGVFIQRRSKQLVVSQVNRLSSRTFAEKKSTLKNLSKQAKNSRPKLAYRPGLLNISKCQTQRESTSSKLNTTRPLKSTDRFEYQDDIIQEYIDEPLEQEVPPPVDLGMQEVYRFQNNSLDLKPKTYGDIRELQGLEKKRKMNSHAIPTASASPAPENFRYRQLQGYQYPSQTTSNLLHQSAYLPQFSQLAPFRSPHLKSRLDRQSLPMSRRDLDESRKVYEQFVNSGSLSSEEDLQSSILHVVPKLQNEELIRHLKIKEPPMGKIHLGRRGYGTSSNQISINDEARYSDSDLRRVEQSTLRMEDNGTVHGKKIDLPKLSISKCKVYQVTVSSLDTE